MDPERWQRVNGLFHAALERPAAERDAFLDAACAGDAGLHAEVASLLASHREDDFLEVPAAALSAREEEREAAGADARGEASLVGRRIGPYEVTAEIGHGGIGIVYLGRDTRLNRPVAIKALRPDWTSDPQRRARLTREARAAAALSHPGIATVYALEEFDGNLYIVGEYVRGETLRDELARGPLGPDHLLDTALALARALAFAHARGVIHRDLKPENLMRAADGTLKILDFGLARLEESSGRPGPAATHLTADGSVLGTPAYMSPEQIRGQPVDFRTDLFSFGVVMYELATGGSPFTGRDSIATIARVLDEEAAPLERSAPVPPALAGIVTRCLRKSPAERYHSTNDLVSDLERLQARGAAPGVRVAPFHFEMAAVADRKAPTRWWQVHQAVTGLAPCVLLFPLWRVQSWVPGVAGLLLFVASASTAVAIATLRVHLWFTSRVYPQELRLQRARTRPWILVAELAYLCLLLLGAALVAAEHREFAALLAGAGVALAIASAIIEPATTRAAFGPEPK